MSRAPDSVVLEEEVDPDYEPSEEEIIEYAKWLGIDPIADKDLLYLAKEGLKVFLNLILKAPLPPDWKPCQTADSNDIYYFNFRTGESTWEHPCDEYYKKLYEEAKKKKMRVFILIIQNNTNNEKKKKEKEDINAIVNAQNKKNTALGSLKPIGSSNFKVFKYDYRNKMFYIKLQLVIKHYQVNHL